MIKRIPLWAKIILGMLLGFAWGLIALKTGLSDFTTGWIKPLGTILLKLLKLVAVPLIFVSLVKGVSSITEISKLSRIGMKTISYYIATTLIATTFGLLLVNIVRPGSSFPANKRSEFLGEWENTLSQKQAIAEGSDSTPLQFFEEMVPENIFEAMGDNSKMLQVIFFSVLFAIAMVLVPSQKVRTVKLLFSNLNDIILKIVEIIMLVTPYGVFGLIAGVVVDFAGDSDIFLALGKYFITTILGLMFMLLVLYPAYLKIFTRGVGIPFFLKAMLPAQMVGLATSSSAAALPVTLKQVTGELGVSEEIANFVLPVGVTINMDGAAFYQSVAAVFIAQVYGIELTAIQQITIVLTATLTSIGSPGVPGGIIVLMILVLSAVGLPPEGLALIIGLDRPIDMLRSAVNLTGDATISTIIAYSEGELKNQQG